MNLVIPRFFCRVVCPLGALLGRAQQVLALADRARSPQVHRLRPVPAELRGGVRSAHPAAQERVLRLLQLHRGLPARRHLRFRSCRCPTHEIANPADPGAAGRLRRGGGRGLFCRHPRRPAHPTRTFSKTVIRPPGSVEEHEFLERCIKCDQCIRVCPTNVLQPALLEAGLEGLWTPVMNITHGLLPAELHRSAVRSARPGPSSGSPSPRRLGIGRLRRPGPGHASAPPSTTSAAACPGRRTSPAWSARRSARLPPRRSTRAK